MLEVNGRFEFVAPNGIDSACWLRVWILKDQPMQWLVLMTEIGVGMSVTNAIEKIVAEVCKEYDLDPGRCLFVEHYDWRDSGKDSLDAIRYAAGLPDETFDLVTFRSYGGRLANPIWRKRTREEVERTIGEKILPHA